MKANHNKLNSKAQYVVATREGVSIKYKYMYITQLQINVILGIRHVFSTDLDRVEVKVLILSNNSTVVSVLYHPHSLYVLLDCVWLWNL